ncbi:hypothetical protein [Rhizobium terrae]|uniref:hypothetical protein n=1 Tax=Rhizobium terrae TaxID=2171756 RepID=UPI000E3E5217|nr:hypothetical protein [Rhizobium terrae]
MLFGQSVFQSVLTRLKREREEDEAEETGVDFRVRGLGTGFVAASDDGPSTVGTGTEAYFAFLPELLEIEREPLQKTRNDEPLPIVQIPPHLTRLTQQEIAEELAITDSDTEAMLGEKRRRFARANHPDGVPEAFRENANIRMKTANLLIDTAIKGRFWR